jgi:hypothetical protein
LVDVWRDAVESIKHILRNQAGGNISPSVVFFGVSKALISAT